MDNKSEILTTPSKQRVQHSLFNFRNILLTNQNASSKCKLDHSSLFLKCLVSHALPLRMHANKPPVSQGEKNFIKATDL